ncbi:hypothetical protein FA014_04905 [Cellulomonas hominis]|uniref:ESX-1 secretion-associated protein n=1 Tax=Cellulomonas hominis TaxID=156981 RepID=A0A7Z8NRI6_9CELL|nr:hypothetical protein [Cellulomonas hominis]TKR26564.1 hypothetical protein FA014_04905 [Cellulomonas hominis]
MTAFRVDVGALARARAAHHDLSAQFAALESDRAAADLPDGALGKMISSDEILAAFRSRYTGLGEAIAALTEAYRNIGDGLAVTADGYAQTDAQVADLQARLEAVLR